MEIFYKNNTLSITSEKKEILFQENLLLIDDFSIEYPGEYEKSGFLVYIRELDGHRYYHLRVEGYWIGYIPEFGDDIDSDILDFFGQLHILLAPMGKKESKILAKIEPKLLITYGNTACEMPQVLGYQCEVTPSYKVMASDFSGEKTGLVILG